MRKNIVLYFSDQQRHDTCGCYGQPLPITPNLDRLAAEGVLFENAFSPQPVCGPCRAIFQTGKYATDTGCFRNNICLPHNVKTLADYLEEGGYETAYIGKWHLSSGGNAKTNTPGGNYRTVAVPQEYRGGYHGFWRAADTLEFTSHGYDGYIFDEKNRRIDFTGYRSDCINEFALEFLEQYDGKKPFYMTVSQIEPHHQNDHRHYEGPRGSKEKYKNFVLPGDLQALQGNAAREYPDYLGQCASLDENLGRLVQKLKDRGLYENTVIIYVSDHGSHFMTRNQDAHRLGGDDYKRSCHDSSIHVPLVISGGPYRGGRRISDLVSTESLPKTILSLAGIDVGENMIGEDLLEVAEGRTEGRVNEVYAQISESRVARSIRTEHFTYSAYAPGLDGRLNMSSNHYEDDFLYDLDKDPFQLQNLAEDPAYEAVRQQLRSRLAAWIEKTEGIPVTIGKQHTV